MPCSKQIYGQLAVEAIWLNQASIRSEHADPLSNMPSRLQTPTSELCMSGKL